jgi:hypothetical protein
MIEISRIARGRWRSLSPFIPFLFGHVYLAPLVLSFNDILSFFSF